MERRLRALGLAGATLVALGWFACHRQDDRVERVSAVLHEEWVAWSKNVAPEVSAERRDRWEKLWVPYDELPESEKEKDREWARKALEAARGR